MTALLLLACLSDGERPLPAATATVPTPLVVPMREHAWNRTAGDRSVPAELGGPGFTGAGWSTRAAAHALGFADAPQGGTFTRAAATDEEVGAIARMLAFEPLLEPHAVTGEPSQRPAAPWQIPSGGRTWKFRLDRAARWSDGTPVTAGDVVAAARRAGRPEAVAFSPNLVQVRAEEASWRALTSFAALPLVSPSWLGSGPYRTDGTSLVRRADWWGDPDPVWDPSRTCERTTARSTSRPAPATSSRSRRRCRRRAPTRRPRVLARDGPATAGGARREVECADLEARCRMRAC